MGLPQFKKSQCVKSKSWDDNWEVPGVQIWWHIKQWMTHKGMKPFQGPDSMEFLPNPGSWLETWHFLNSTLQRNIIRTDEKNMPSSQSFQKTGALWKQASEISWVLSLDVHPYLLLHFVLYQGWKIKQRRALVVLKETPCISAPVTWLEMLLPISEVNILPSTLNSRTITHHKASSHPYCLNGTCLSFKSYTSFPFRSTTIFVSFRQGYKALSLEPCLHARLSAATDGAQYMPVQWTNDWMGGAKGEN